jgi:hypothetical protein
MPPYLHIQPAPKVTSGRGFGAASFIKAVLSEKMTAGGILSQYRPQGEVGLDVREEEQEGVIFERTPPQRRQQE